MSKTKDKKTEESPKTASGEKTEWQKRHEAFLERQKARQEAERKRQEEEEARKKEALEALQESQEQKETASEETDAPEEEIAEDVEESPRKQGKQPKRWRFKKKEAPSEEEKKAKRPARIALAKAVSVILIALVVLLVSLFVASPLSKAKTFTVTGLDNADETDVLVATGIRQSDYMMSVIMNENRYEKAIVSAIPWVKSAEITYDFPNHFTIAVKEHRVIAYAQTKAGYQPVLETGVRMPVVSSSQLPEHFLTVNLTNEKDVQVLVDKLAGLDDDLVSNIQIISPLKSDTTKDLLLLEMHDGNQIRVPLSQLDVKLPYYQTIKKTLSEPTIIDMEVGLYATTATIEALIAEEKPQREAEIKERKAAEEQAEKESTSESETSEGERTEEGSETDVTEPTTLAEGETTTASTTESTTESSTSE